jgi:transposase
MRHRSGTIRENLVTLQRLEQEYRGQSQELRLKALRLLKEDPKRTLRQVAALLGRSYRTIQRWWSIYQHHGLKQLLQVGQTGGKRPPKLSAQGFQKLQARLQEDGFADLKEVQPFLQEQVGVSYSLPGVRYLLRVRLQAKLKTGRTRSVRQDPKAATAFKKRAWRS